MRRILVPTDFSENAFKAIAYAAETARITRATVHLLHVIEPALNMATMQTDSLNKKTLQQRRNSLRIKLKSANGVYPDVKIRPFLAGGKVVESILKHITEQNIDLVIMGTEGAGGLKKYFLGTTTAGTVEKATVPVLAVPAVYQVKQPEVVIFATNQFEKDTSLLRRVMQIPEVFSTEVHVVVFKEDNAEEGAEYIYNEDQLQDYVQYLQDAFPGTTFKGALLEGDSFKEAIDHYCERVVGDLVAMVTYPKSFFERIFQRSETKQMVFDSERPVLAVPARGALIQSETLKHTI